MKTLLTILLLIGLNESSWGLCAEDNRTITELLFKGSPGTIFTCNVLTMTVPKSKDNIETNFACGGRIDGTATVEIFKIYFGKVDTNIITLKTGSYLKVGSTYLIYGYGSGRSISCGGSCDRRTKEVSGNPAVKNELQILKQFSDIFKNKSTGAFTFTNSKNGILAKGQFKNGMAINIWHHFYENGNIKSEYNLAKNIASQFSSNGFIKSKTTINKNIGIYEQFSDKVRGKIAYKSIEVDTGKEMIMENSEYYSNGNLKTLSSAAYINNKSTSTGKTGEYEEYYENGQLKLKGQYQTNKRVGLWKWYAVTGKFNTQFDYKNGSDKQ